MSDLSVITRTAITMATAADGDAILHALREVAGTRILNEPTAAYLAKTQYLTLANAVGLAAVLDVHAPALHKGREICIECAVSPCRTIRRITEAAGPYLPRIPRLGGAE